MFAVPSHYLLHVLGNVFPEDFFQDFPRGLGEAKWHVPWVSEGVCKIYFFFSKHQGHLLHLHDFSKRIADLVRVSLFSQHPEI